MSFLKAVLKSKLSSYKAQQELISISLYYKQLSADLKINNYKIKNSFVIPKMLKARTNKRDYNMIIHFCSRRKLGIIRYMIYHCG